MRSPRLPLLVLASAFLAAACGAGPGATIEPSPTGTPIGPAPSVPSGAPSAMGPVADASVVAGRTFLSTGHDDHQLAPGTQVRLTFRDACQLGTVVAHNAQRDHEVRIEGIAG